MSRSRIAGGHRPPLQFSRGYILTPLRGCFRLIPNSSRSGVQNLGGEFSNLETNRYVRRKVPKARSDPATRGLCCRRRRYLFIPMEHTLAGGSGEETSRHAGNAWNGNGNPCISRSTEPGKHWRRRNLHRAGTPPIDRCEVGAGRIELAYKRDSYRR